VLPPGTVPLILELMELPSPLKYKEFVPPGIAIDASDIYVRTIIVFFFVSSSKTNSIVIGASEIYVKECLRISKSV